MNNKKPLHQRFSELDNQVFEAFLSSFKNITFIKDFKDNEDAFCGIDLQLTATSKTNKQDTYDVELKSVHLNKLLPYCFFQSDKWLSLVEFENDKKLYVAIYPNHDLIAIWNVTSSLLENSEKQVTSMKRNTMNGDATVEKQVYLLELSSAKLFNFNLTEFKDQYDALYLQRRQDSKEKEHERETAST